jgi:hypothetical protein
MAHSDVRLLTVPDGYKLCLGEDESELVPFGEPLEWEAPNGKKYLAFVDLPEGAGDEAQNVESLLPSWVYEAKALEHVEPEDEEDDEGDEDDEDDDGDDVPEVEGDDVTTPTADLGPGDDEDDDDDEGEGEPIYG